MQHCIIPASKDSLYVQVSNLLLVKVLDEELFLQRHAGMHRVPDGESIKVADG